MHHATGGCTLRQRGHLLDLHLLLAFTDKQRDVHGPADERRKVHTGHVFEIDENVVNGCVGFHDRWVGKIRRA
jgi:hypothetical protein